jgi:flagella synthesis protein FlgN
MTPLRTLLEREITLVSRFVAALNEEQDALKAARPEALPKIQEEKSVLVEQLNSLETERTLLVGGASEKTNRQRMLAWLAAHPAEIQIHTHWHKLLELAEEARRQNELNAALVKLHLDKTSQALAILTRHSQESLLYGSNGQAAIYTGSRIVDLA